MFTFKKPTKLFSKATSKIHDQHKQTAQILKLSNYESLQCKRELTEKELYHALRNITSNKSPENNGLAKEFYLSFWDDVKDIYT